MSKFQTIIKKAYQNYKLIQHQIPISQCKPIIVTDIDGVLVRGSDQIPKTYQALIKLRSNQIPLACLTNGGGQTEKIKTYKLNQLFKQSLFKSDLMFLNHTPLKPELINHSKKQGYLLVCGSNDIPSILSELNISNFITTDQIYGILANNQNNHQNKQNQSFGFFDYSINREEILSNISKRLNIPIQNIPKTYNQWAQKINSIFALNDISPYQTTLQCIHNILLSKKYSQNNHKLTYFAAQNDTQWASLYNLPRMAFGPFNNILKNHCNNHNLSLDHIYYGKPTIRAFQYVEKVLKNKFPQTILFFMIGDNPQADIRGANNIGWYSFLTQTGIHTSSLNDVNDPATFVVSNFAQAVDIVCDLNQKIKTLQ